MTLRDVFKNGPARTVLVLWLASSVFVLFLMKWIESTLIYGLFEKTYGLQYNAVWGNLYTIYMYTIYSFILVPMALSAAVLILGFLDEKKHAQLQESKSKDATPEAMGATPEAKDAPPEIMKENILISCPNCKKVFSRPMILLDSSGVSPKLVDVCPYCNSKLQTENAKPNADTSIVAVAQSKKEATTP